MEVAVTDRLTVGIEADAREIAVAARRGGSPGLFWLTGYIGHMGGEKVSAVETFALRSGLASARFDYSGHGQSGGDFLDGTISRWLEETEAVFRQFTAGPQIVLGSSMGGWLALLLAEALRRQGESRIAGLILVAPATDMTQDLMWDRFTKKARALIEKTGGWAQPGEYPERGHNVVTRKLIEDGKLHLFGDRPIEVGCPVHILQGLADQSVPWTHATRLVERLASDDVVLTLIKDGDHRLSRPEDIERLLKALDGMVGAEA